MRKHLLINVALAWLFTIAVSGSAASTGDEPVANRAGPRSKPYDPTIAKASDEAKRAISSFQVPVGLAVLLFAAEPHLANPVAFCLDEKGVAYVAETFRLNEGVTDTRGHMDWLDDDLACRTVADRVAMYRKYLGKTFETYHLQHERVRRIVDRDGDGQADAATVFADGFNDPAAGIGAGVLARKQDVWYACIPWLWKLRDTSGDGRAKERTLLHEGYGVHVGFFGHDLHGLRFGPDGKLYFSIGDRGFNVTTLDGRALSVPDTGSVLRCNPDGTELEVFATGLRNPQELAFDEYGNLFTGDNNSDSGDRARWVYVVEGGDSGWRIGYQFIEAPNSRGPWNEEKLWHPAFAGQAAYIVPPIANIADGPSGLTYDPGVSLLPAQYHDHFFLVDFRGSSGSSGIRTFTLKPKGASFQLVDPQKFIWSVLATDVDFGPDGALYFSDWVEGWEKPNKGRIYRVIDRARTNDPQVQEVKTLLAQGMDGRAEDELARLLAHTDMRVRLEAQFELAARGDKAWGTLARIAGSKGNTLARIHAVWGLGQAARAARGGRRQTPCGALVPLLDDADPEVRSQAAKVLGDAREPSALDPLIGLLGDPSPRVRFFAAIALGKLGRREAIEPLCLMLDANADLDPYLRHAGVMGLFGSGNRAAWKTATRPDSPPARIGILLAMRRDGDPGIARFLNDPDPRLVLEAARAINDVPIAEAMPALAAIPVSSSMSLPLLRRVLNANFRLGQAEHAATLVAAAARPDVPTTARVQALGMLATWAKPPGRDPIVGLWRPIGPRSIEPAALALGAKVMALFSAKPTTVRTAAVLATAALRLKGAGVHLAALAGDREQADETRAQALKALDVLNDPGQVEAARRALILPGSRSRIEALRLLAKIDPAAAIAPLQDQLAHGRTAERQGAIAILAAMPGDAARRELLSWLDRLVAGQVPAEIRLDLIEAAARRTEPELRRKLEQYESAKTRSDPLAPYREVLAGGDPQRGMAIFATRTELECVRCHKVKGLTGESDGSGVGPELSGIGARQTRTYLLESLLDPNKQIAQGFESVMLATSDGAVHTGVFRGEDAKEVRLITALGKRVAVPKGTIEERKSGPSAMPNDLVRKLSKSELRDLIEFLADLKTP